MAWLIGVDEAGYGPNLGPLVVAATAWRVPDDTAPGAAGDDLYAVLADAVSREPRPDRIALADSKRLYSPGKGLRPLERGVWSAIGCGYDWGELVGKLGADPAGRRGELPWHKAFRPDLPVDASTDELSAAARQLRQACDAAGVAAPRLRARLVFPSEFNDLVDRYGTKGAALSHATLGLLRAVIDTATGDAAGGGRARRGAATGGPIRCTLDKHGGRNRYGALLQHHFPDAWIETAVESRAESRYAWGPPERRIQAAFCTGGEAFLPAALASMTAKYLRELSMAAFNAFWTSRVPGLKPTAGYPVDAKRFKQAIRSKQAELGIDDHLLWRNR
ncbi:MAG: hypothetical protein AAGB00_11075 [Planctomycetota bacterium]